MANAEQVIQSTVLQATKALEEQLDSEIEKLERLDDDDIEKLRHKRLQQVHTSNISFSNTPFTIMPLDEESQCPETSMDQQWPREIRRAPGREGILRCVQEESKISLPFLPGIDHEVQDSGQTLAAAGPQTRGDSLH